jgi:hypothetical protein
LSHFMKFHKIESKASAWNVLTTRQR